MLVSQRELGVEASHGNLLFRLSRTVANANESMAVFILIVLFCLCSGADATYTGYLAWAYVVGRVGDARCYDSKKQMLRSLCFGISLLLLLVMLIVGFVTQVGFVTGQTRYRRAALLGQ